MLGDNSDMKDEKILDDTLMAAFDEVLKHFPRADIRQLFNKFQNYVIANVAIDGQETDPDGIDEDPQTIAHNTSHDSLESSFNSVDSRVSPSTPDDISDPAAPSLHSLHTDTAGTFSSSPADKLGGLLASSLSSSILTNSSGTSPLYSSGVSPKAAEPYVNKGGDSRKRRAVIEPNPNLSGDHVNGSRLNKLIRDKKLKPTDTEENDEKTIDNTPPASFSFGQQGK